MKYVYGTFLALILAGATFGIFWSASRDFGTQQAVEFFPYISEIEIDDSRTIRSSGVVVRINEFEAAPDDRSMATFMTSAKRMYPDECTGENWEIAVRRPNPDGGEEKYSYSWSVYETEGPGSWVEYGKWVDDLYVVIESYPADWSEITSIAHGDGAFLVRME
jgi:hypothetical protein